MRSLLSLIAAAWLAASASASAGPFEMLGQARSVSIAATLSLDDWETGDFRSLSGSDYRVAPDLGTFDAAVGLSGFFLYTSAGAASGSGRAAQRSTLASDAIRFDGFADVYVGGYANWNGYVTASGGAFSSFYVEFAVTAPLRVRLDMSSMGVTGDGADTDFRFALLGPDGTAVWDQTWIIADPYGSPRYTYSTVLSLAPGRHTLGSYLAAYSWFESSYGGAGQASAMYALTPLTPSVQLAGGDSLALLALGLALGALRTGRPLRRRGVGSARRHERGPLQSGRPASSASMISGSVAAASAHSRLAGASSTVRT